MGVTERAETIEQSIFRIAASLTKAVEIQQEVVRDLCAHLLQLRAAFPDQPTEWYRRSCELRAEQYLRQITAQPKTKNRWLPELKDETFVARLTPRLTPKQQQVLALLLEDIGMREAGRRLGVSHVAVIKHRRKIERAASRLLQTGAAALLLFATLPIADGATRTKAGSGTQLNLNSAWAGGTQPDGTDTALWNNTSTTGNHTLGGNLTWGEIEVVNPGNDITFQSTGGFTLTLNGVAGVGIDMASATRNLTIQSTLALGASQEWNIGASRTLSVGTVNGSGHTLTKTGSGTLTLASGAVFNNVTLILNAGTLELNGNNLTVSSLAGSGGTIQNTGPNSTFTVTAGADNTDTTFSGTFRDGSGQRKAALTKVGTGVLTLAGDNSNSSALTTISGGVLRLNHANALSTGSLTINGGVLELQNPTSFTRALGTSSGQVQLTGGVSGFSAFGGARTVNLGGSGGAITWGGSTFAPTTLVLNESTADAKLTFVNALNLGSATRTVAVNANTAEISGILSGSGGALTKNGAGTLQLTGNNTYTGLTTINAGTIQVGHANALGTTAAGVSVASGATLDLKGFAVGAEAVTLNGGALVNSSATAASLTGAVTVDSASTAGGSGDLTLSGVISGSGALTKTGAGVLTFSGSSANTRSGLTTVNAGQLRLNKSSGNALDGNLTITAGTVQLLAANQIADTSAVTVGGTLDLNGQNDTIGELTMAGGLVTTGAGALTLGGNVTGNAAATTASITGNLNLNGATRTFTVADGTAATDLSVGAVIANGGLIKSGAGVMAISGANTYAGGTTVAAGTLRVNNTTGSGTGSGAVTVQNGATLGGTGNISGDVTVANGGTLAAGNSVGTLNVATLTLNNGATMEVEFTTGGANNDKVIVANSNGLTLHNVGFQLYQENTVTTFDTRGLYQLIQYSGAIGGSGISGLSVLNPVNNRIYNFGAGGGWVTLSIGGSVGWAPSNTSPDSYWLTGDNWGGGSAPLEHDSLLFDGNTRTINTNNFTAHTRFSGIVFTNTAGAFVLDGNAVNLTGNIQNRSTQSQTLNLPVRLEGGTRVVDTLNGNIILNGVVSATDSTLGLTKQGQHLLELNGANTYAGTTEIAGGTLRANSGTGLPTASNLKLNGGVLEGNGPVTFNRARGTGSGQVQWTGSGGFSAYGGTMIVNLAGGALTWGSGHFVPIGSELIFGSTAADSKVELQNAINLAGAVRTIRVLNNSSSDDDYAEISGVLSNGGLLKTGSGTLVLSGANTFTDAVTVQGGTLVVKSAVGLNAALTLQAGTVLAGSGVLSQGITGSGLVAPGASPGILTVADVDPTGGLDFTFEFTQIGSPDYSNPTASLNDVLRITGATPFTANLDLNNVVTLNVNATLTAGVTNFFRGGFYADNGGAFDDAITNGTFQVFVNGQAWGAPVVVRTVNETGTQFSGVDGFVMEFGILGESAAVIPEPGVLTLYVGGLLTFWMVRRRRDTSPESPRPAPATPPMQPRSKRVRRRRRKTGDPILFLA